MESRDKLNKRTMGKKEVPSLASLCVVVAIDNVAHIGDVGCIPEEYLEKILPHCTKDQLAHIERSTKGRDLSPVTDKLWKKFYELEFGVKCAQDLIERMKLVKVSFNWQQLYEAKLKAVAEDNKNCMDRLKQSYKKLEDEKLSRKTKLCEKFPPAAKCKRSFYGAGGPSYNVSNVKGNLMKKSKLDFLKSREVRNAVAMKTMAAQRNRTAAPVIKSGKSIGASTSKPVRRF